MARRGLVRFTVLVVLIVGALGIGSALHLPALAAAEYARAVAPFTTCSGGAACLLETNNGSGPGVKSVSAGGNGMIAQTTFKSTGVKNGEAGVLGQDSSATGSYDSGVKGTSYLGTGVYGTSTYGNGVDAYSVYGSAVYAENTGFEDGIQSVALGNDGTNSSTQNPSGGGGRGRSGVWGHDDSSDGGTLNNGVTGSSTNGTGVEGISTNYVGVEAIGGGNPATSYEDPALSVTSANAENSVYEIAVCNNPADVPCTANESVMYVDFIGNVNTAGGFTASGDIDVAGEYLQDGNCFEGCSKIRHSRHGTAQRRYVTTASLPSVEDYGEAQLVNGQASVALRPDFANVIDRDASYLVFVTPEGNTNGLYIAQKNPSGFTVRENNGGHASVAFEYRIVARPFGSTDARLPMVEIGRPPTRGGTHG
jgi:hypothetical protein